MSLRKRFMCVASCCFFKPKPPFTQILQVKVDQYITFNKFNSIFFHLHALLFHIFKSPHMHSFVSYVKKIATSNDLVKNSSRFILSWQRRAVCIKQSLNYVPVFDCHPHTLNWTIEFHLMDMGLKSTSALKLLFFFLIKDFEACVMYAKLLSNYFL